MNQDAVRAEVRGHLAALHGKHSPTELAQAVENAVVAGIAVAQGFGPTAVSQHAMTDEEFETHQERITRSNDEKRAADLKRDPSLVHDASNDPTVAGNIEPQHAMVETPAALAAQGAPGVTTTASLKGVGSDNQEAPAYLAGHTETDGAPLDHNQAAVKNPVEPQKAEKPPAKKAAKK